MSKDTTKTTINELFNLISEKRFLELINQPGIDKYVKKLTVYKYFVAMVWSQLKDIASITHLSSSIQDDKKLQEFMDIETISKSQLSRKQNNLSSDIFETVYHQLASEVQVASIKTELFHKIRAIHAIDSTTMTLALSEHRWAQYLTTKAGVKLHLGVVVTKAGVVPNKAVITEAKQSDRSQMDELIVEDSNAIQLFDRGYNDYKQFDRLCSEDIRFVTRLKKNAQFEVIEEHPINQDHNIFRDAKIVLGKEQARTKMSHVLRMIETKDLQNKPVTIMTNCFDLSAKEIGDLYRYRWKIETFFKWMKQHLKINTFFGKSQNVIYTQIWIALITYCLQMYMLLKYQYQGTLLEFKRKLQTFLFDSLSSLIQSFVKITTKKSKDRRTIDYIQEYETIMKDYDDGNTAFYENITDYELFFA